MRDLLRHLRAAWLYTKTMPYAEEADADSFWTPADERSLATFFNSYTGKKLKIRLANYAIKAAMAAVKTPENSQYNIGVAAGIPMGIAAIEAHMRVPQTIGEADEAGLLDELAIDTAG